MNYTYILYSFRQYRDDCEDSGRKGRLIDEDFTVLKSAVSAESHEDAAKKVLIELEGKGLDNFVFDPEFPCRNTLLYTTSYRANGHCGDHQESVCNDNFLACCKNATGKYKVDVYLKIFASVETHK